MNNALDFLTAVAAEDRASVAYRQQALVLEIADRVHTRIQELDISRAVLARRMRVSRPMITKLLTGDSNFQLKTLIRLADALDMELMLNFVPEGFRLPLFYIDRGVSSMGAYTQHSANIESELRVPRQPSKKEIVPAGGKRDTSEYTVFSHLRVA